MLFVDKPHLFCPFPYNGCKLLINRGELDCLQVKTMTLFVVMFTI